MDGNGGHALRGAEERGPDDIQIDVPAKELWPVDRGDYPGFTCIHCTPQSLHRTIYLENTLASSILLA